MTQHTALEVKIPQHQNVVITSVGVEAVQREDGLWLVPDENILWLCRDVEMYQRGDGTVLLTNGKILVVVGEIITNTSFYKLVLDDQILWVTIK